jgi:hypothetical protein
MNDPRARTILEGRRFMKKRMVEIGVFAAATLLQAGAGHAAPKVTAQSCTVAYKSAVKAQQASHLQEAQKWFAACSQQACGTLIRRECLLSYDQISADIPTIVPVVTTVTGEPVLDVKITMDGALLASKIDGRALPVDPGLHEFTFITHAGSATQKIVILQGQRNRPIAMAMAAPGQQPQTNGQPRAAMAAVAAPTAPVLDVTAAEPPPFKAGPPSAYKDSFAADESSSVTTHRPIARYIATGVGLLGVGGYALLTYWGRKDNDMLVQCKPDCMQSSVDHVRKIYLAANISLGVGIAALGTATWLYFRSSDSRQQEAAAGGTPVALDVVPLSNGALASVRGAF